MQESQNLSTSSQGGSAQNPASSSTPEKSSKGSALEALLGKFSKILLGFDGTYSWEFYIIYVTILVTVYKSQKNCLVSVRRYF